MGSASSDELFQRICIFGSANDVERGVAQLAPVAVLDLQGLELGFDVSRCQSRCIRVVDVDSGLGDELLEQDRVLLGPDHLLGYRLIPVDCDAFHH